jgi:hypothetical protein
MGPRAEVSKRLTLYSARQALVHVDLCFTMFLIYNGHYVPNCAFTL